MLLKGAPIYQTLELKWRVAAQPRNSALILQNNVILFNWGEPVEVSYVPDPTPKVRPFKTLTIKEGKVLADSVQVGAAPMVQ
jgi:hypothetical protein